jgi:antitoxin (DNA-binding transcriptional repressor) of toxin-antitoxin stability system
MKLVHASAARQRWSRLLGHVFHTGERILICRSGKTVAGLVPPDDVALLELLSDECDIDEARAAIRKAKRQGQAPAAWKEVRSYAGLDR